MKNKPVGDKGGVTSREQHQALLASFLVFSIRPALSDGQQRLSELGGRDEPALVLGVFLSMLDAGRSGGRRAGGRVLLVTPVDVVEVDDGEIDGHAVWMRSVGFSFSIQTFHPSNTMAALPTQGRHRVVLDPAMIRALLGRKEEDVEYDAFKCTSSFSRFIFNVSWIQPNEPPL